MIAELDDYYKTMLCKRVYLPYFFRTNCQTCGNELRSDYTRDNYIQNPVCGEIVQIHFYCEKCLKEQHEEALFEILVTPTMPHKPLYKVAKSG